MIDFLKWFWTNISFRKWTFEGRKLNNPLIIIWRLIMWPILWIAVLILGGLFYISGDSDAAKDILEQFI